VVQLRETGGRVEVLESDAEAVAYSGPLTILVDRFSASASEIFAAAMQDYGRGVVIGQETYGKGTVQNLYPLDPLCARPGPGIRQLTVTIGMYYRVTGDSTQNRGVQPDIRLPSAISPTEVGESSRDAALPWNRIRPTRYTPDGALTPLISDLQSRHDQRAAADPDFQHALAEIATIERMRSQSSVSLNLEQRRAERASLSETSSRGKTIGARPSATSRSSRWTPSRTCRTRCWTKRPRSPRTSLRSSPATSHGAVRRADLDCPQRAQGTVVLYLTTTP